MNINGVSVPNIGPAQFNKEWLPEGDYPFEILRQSTTHSVTYKGKYYVQTGIVTLPPDQDANWELIGITEGGGGGGGGMTNPMTTAGDMIIGGTGGAPVSLAKGTTGQVLTIDPTTLLPVWKAPTTTPTTSDVVMPNVLYVATTGNNTTGDGSITKPYASINKAYAIANGTTPKKVITVLAGNYTENITALAGITLQAFAPKTVFIDGSHTFSGDGDYCWVDLDLSAKGENLITVSGTNAVNIQFNSVCCESSYFNSTLGRILNWINTSVESKMLVNGGAWNSKSEINYAIVSSSSDSAGTLHFRDLSIKAGSVDCHAIAIAGGLNIIHTYDNIRGLILISDKSTYTGTFVHFDSGANPAFNTTSTGISSLNSCVINSTATNAVDGTGGFIHGDVGFINTGVLFANTLNGGAGALSAPLTSPKLSPQTLVSTIQDGLIEYDGNAFYASSNSTRSKLSLLLGATPSIATGNTLFGAKATALSGTGNTFIGNYIPTTPLTNFTVLAGQTGLPRIAFNSSGAVSFGSVSAFSATNQILFSQGSSFAPKWVDANVISSLNTYTTVSPTINVSDSLSLLNATTNKVAATLPTANIAGNCVITITRTDTSANTCTIDSASTISGSSAPIPLKPYQSYTLTSNSSAWFITGGYNPTPLTTQQLYTTNLSEAVIDVPTNHDINVDKTINIDLGQAITNPNELTNIQITAMLARTELELDIDVDISYSLVAMGTSGYYKVQFGTVQTITLNKTQLNKIDFILPSVVWGGIIPTGKCYLQLSYSTTATEGTLSVVDYVVDSNTGDIFKAIKQLQARLAQYDGLTN